MVLVMRLLMPPPKGTRAKWIDRNASCPACGNCEGALQFTRINPTRSGLDGGEPRVKHSCKVCKFEWFDKPAAVPDEPAV